MHKPLASVILFLASLTSVHAQQSTCYRRSNGAVQAQSSSWIQCNNTATQSGGAELCCLSGSECGADSICRSVSTRTGQSRWYVGACTDPEYNDAICRQDCTQYKQTFITYETNQWQCCGNSGCNETPNADETFSAVSPSQWLAIVADSESSGGSDDSSTSSSGGGDHLTFVDILGISIAASIAIIGPIAVGLLWFYRGPKRSRKTHHGVRGRYEEIGRQLAASPDPSTVPYGARDNSPQPYGRSTSPIPPLPSMQGQRDRSRSIAMEERIPLPENMR